MDRSIDANKLKIVFALFVCVPLILTPKITIDAINPGKLFLFTLAAALAVLWGVGYPRPNSIRNRLLLFFFLLGTTLPLIFSGAPILQQIFGYEGRNIGFITYFACFAALYFGSIASSEISGLFVRRIFFYSASLSVIYGLFQSQGIDFIAWKYPNTFGTLGNINFFSAQLAIIFSGLLGFFAQPSINKSKKIFLIASMTLCLYLLYCSNSSQGLVIIFISLILVLFIKLRNVRIIRYRWMLPSILGIFSFVIIFVFVMRSFILILIDDNLFTIRIRSYFWLAAINMFASKPLFGVGLDSYGDWYRSARPLMAQSGGDLGEAADSAHNLVLDYAATGGVFLLLFGLLIIFLVLQSTITIVKRVSNEEKGLDSNALPIALSSIAFLVQAMVSPQQIGLLSWGYLICGLCIGYAQKGFPSDSRRSSSHRTRLEFSSIEKSKNLRNWRLILMPLLFGISVLPLSMIWKEHNLILSQKSEDVDRFARAIESFPRSAYYYRNGIAILVNAGYHGKASVLAVKAFKEYNENYPLLMVLKNVRALDSTIVSKVDSQLKVLDPPR